MNASESVRPIKKIVTAVVVIVALLAMVYIYPRFLVSRLGEASPWTSYLYQYGFGLVVFLIGIILILRSGACRFGRGHDTFWFGVLIVGFLVFSIGHAVWIWAALSMPYLGAP